MERTLAIIKPDAVQRNLAGKILARLEAEGFVILGLKMVYLSKQDAERFYEVHRGRPFFESLTSYMASGPAIPILLQRDNAIQALRESDGSYQPHASSHWHHTPGIWPRRGKKCHARLRFPCLSRPGNTFFLQLPRIP